MAKPYFSAQEYVKKSISEAIDWANRFPKKIKGSGNNLGTSRSKLARKDIQATANWAKR